MFSKIIFLYVVYSYVCFSDLRVAGYVQRLRVRFFLDLCPQKVCLKCRRHSLLCVDNLLVFLPRVANAWNGSVFCLNKVEPTLHEEAVVVLRFLLLMFIRVQYCSTKLRLSDI